MVRFAQDGPPRAGVDDFDVSDEEPKGLKASACAEGEGQPPPGGG